MKRLIKMFLILWAVCIYVCSCDVDPYPNWRPIDYEGSCCLCEGEGYKIYLQTEEPMSAVLSIDGKEFKNISFLWDAFSSGVAVYEGNDSKKDSDIFG